MIVREEKIHSNYILDKTLDEYGIENKRNIREAQLEQIQRELNLQRRLRMKAELEDLAVCSSISMGAPAPSAAPIDWDELLDETDAGFSETLLKLIDKTGKKDSDIYKKANVDRKLFSKIRNNPAYKPSKITAVAFALALELNLEETQNFIGRAGYTLSYSSKFDII